jgi:hypothetical protein
MQAEQLASNAEAALSMLPTAIVLIDADQRVRWVNPAAFALLGQQKGLRITDDGELDPLLAAKSRRTCAVSGRRSPAKVMCSANWRIGWGSRLPLLGGPVTARPFTNTVSARRSAAGNSATTHSTKENPPRGRVRSIDSMATACADARLPDRRGRGREGRGCRVRVQTL